MYEVININKYTGLISSNGLSLINMTSSPVFDLMVLCYVRTNYLMNSTKVR